MSRRNLVVDTQALRQEAYSKLSISETQEAIWEALAALQNAGLVVGPKATAILQERDQIKSRIPKVVS